MDISKNKAQFIELLETNVKRDGIKDLIRNLESSDFFTAPASTQYHSAVPGGLCQHSLNVYNRLIKDLKSDFISLEKCPFSLETLAIVALLHDLSKMNYYETSERNTKDEKGNWIKVPYIKVRDDAFLFGTHSVNSFYQASFFICLTHEENIAILHHMGGKDYSDSINDSALTSKIFNQYPLALYLHIADIEATFIDERIIN